MNVMLLAGSANPPLAEAVATRLATELAPRVLERFPDGELQVEIQASVRGQDLYLIQSTAPPVNEHLLELLLLADACQRAGAARLTAIVPYFGYARQDRRASGREPVGARLVADLIGASGMDRVVAVDLHSAAIEGFFSRPLEHLSAVPLLAEAVRPWIDANTVIVAPDLGGAKLAERYARLLHVPVAVVHKVRLSGVEVRALGITGDVHGRAPLIVDDMISTGGTIAAAARALLAAGCEPALSVVASHALLVGPAIERLSDLQLRRLVTSDSVALQSTPPLPLEVVSLAPLLAEVIEHLANDRSLGDLLAHG